MTNQIQLQQAPTGGVDLKIPAIEKYAYCLCLHVKPTTIFIAVFKLIRALLFASILINNLHTLPNEQGNGLFVAENQNEAAALLEIARGILMATVSIAAIYAVISGRAAFLMPLYAILLIDFFFALPSYYRWDMDPSMADSLSELKNISNNGNNAYARYSILLLATITMLIKIYFLCVIWKCYRYLRLIELVTPLSILDDHLNDDDNRPDIHVNMSPPPYDSLTSMAKPPPYDEALNSSTNFVPTINQSNDCLQNTIACTYDTNMGKPNSREEVTDILKVNSASNPVEIVIKDNNNQYKGSWAVLKTGSEQDGQTTSLTKAIQNKEIIVIDNFALIPKDISK